MKKERFIGFRECMRLMRHHNPQLQEEGFHALLPHAHKYVPQLMDEFSQESDTGLRGWLLELIGEARDARAFPLFLEYLQSDDFILQPWAVRGLEMLNTKEARRALWEAGAKDQNLTGKKQ